MHCLNSKFNGHFHTYQEASVYSTPTYTQKTTTEESIFSVESFYNKNVNNNNDTVLLFDIESQSMFDVVNVDNDFYDEIEVLFSEICTPKMQLVCTISQITP